MPQTFTRRCSVKKVFLKVLHKLQINICARVSFLIRCRLEANYLVKKSLRRRCFSLDFAKFSWTTFWQNARGPHTPTKKKISQSWITNLIKISSRTLHRKNFFTRFRISLSPIFSIVIRNGKSFRFLWLWFFLGF